MPRLGSVLMFLVIAGVSASACAVLFGAAEGLAAFADAGYPDSATVLRIRGVVASGRIYPDLQAPPYLASIYGPLTYALFAAVFRLGEAAGIEPVSAIRLLIAISFALCGLGVFAIVKQVFQSKKEAWLSALFAVSPLPLAGWIAQIRGDFPALALSLWSVFLVLGAVRPLHVALAAAGAGAALLVKQTFVAAPATVALWLFYGRRWRDAAIWIVVSALVVLGGYGSAYLREPLLLQHITSLQSPAIDVSGGVEIAWQALTRPTTLFAIVGAAWLIRERGQRESLLVAYCVCAWAVALATIPQSGGNINYFWEPLFIAATLAGPTLSKLRREIDRTNWVVAVAVLVLLARLAAPFLREDLASLKTSYQASKEYHDKKSKWEAFLPIISGKRLLSTIPAVAIRSSVPEAPDPYLNAVLSRGGVWSYAPLTAQAKSGVYDLIVVRENEQNREPYRGVSYWPDDLWDAIERKYARTCLLDGREVWLPREERDSEIAGRLAAIGCEPIRGGSERSHALLAVPRRLY